MRQLKADLIKRNEVLQRDGARKSINIKRLGETIEDLRAQIRDLIRQTETPRTITIKTNAQGLLDISVK